jgi:hypothetical protein
MRVASAARRAGRGSWARGSGGRHLNSTQLPRPGRPPSQLTRTSDGSPLDNAEPSTGPTSPQRRLCEPATMLEKCGRASPGALRDGRAVTGRA